MLCCLTLAGLAIFGPHGMKLYRVLTKARTPTRSTVRPDEPTTSQHLVLAARVLEARQ